MSYRPHGPGKDDETLPPLSLQEQDAGREGGLEPRIDRMEQYNAVQARRLSDSKETGKAIEIRCLDSTVSILLIVFAAYRRFRVK